MINCTDNSATGQQDVRPMSVLTVRLCHGTARHGIYDTIYDVRWLCVSTWQRDIMGRVVHVIRATLIVVGWYALSHIVSAIGECASISTTPFLELTVSDLVATTLGRVTSMSPIHLVVVDFRAMSTWRYHVYYVAMRDNTVSAFVFRWRVKATGS